MSNQELIPVFAGEIAGVPAQLVNARSLHKFLESERQFSNWITYQIDAFGFEQDIDFIKINNFVNGKNSKPLTDYHLSLDMAKELSMVERNAKGKEARRYFIECEKRLLSQIPENIVRAYEILVENLPYVKPVTEAISLAEYETRKQALLQGLHDLNHAKILMTGAELEAFRKSHSV